ncbi:MAG: hypothetical protein ACXAEN_23600, partial [Candidatus Thorarchaeota archaeon]
QQTREQFMTACLADGTDEVTCAKRWDAAHAVNPNVPAATESSASTGSSPMGDVDLLRQIEMLKAQIAVRDQQLTQAIDIAERANNARKAKEQAEKLNLISSIQRDSNFHKNELENKKLGELRTVRLTLDKSLSKTFANVAADIKAGNARKKVHLTAGYYDSASKTWKGGIA